VITVGITGVGGGVGQAVIRSLKYGTLATRVVGMNTRCMAPGFYWANAAYLVPPARDEDAYITRLLEICASELIDVLIPGLDVELIPLARHKDKFSALGCTVIVSSLKVVELCRDKQAFYEFCKTQNLPFVTTFSLSDARSHIHVLSFPVIVKPKSGMASVGVRLINNADELFQIPLSDHLIVQPYISSGNSGMIITNNEDQIGQLDQANEISAQFFIGPSGKSLGSFVSINRLKDGVPMEIVPLRESHAISEGEKIVAALASLGLRGPINLQGKLTPEGVRFFEANARFTGITGVRAALGYREVEAAIRAFVMNQEQEAVHYLSYSPDFLATRYVDETIIPAKRVKSVNENHIQENYSASKMPKRIFISGASGYIGINLLNVLLNNPEVEEVRAGLRNESKGRLLGDLFEKSTKLKIVYGDLIQSSWLMDGIETVIHLAACRPSTLHPDHSAEPFLINSEGTRILLEAARRAGVSRIIYLSSQAVYGTRHIPLWGESLPLQPETPYGLSKWIGELLCVNESTDTLQSIVLRIARVYGLGHFMRWDEMPHKFASLTLKGQPLPLFAGGNQQLDFIHIRDLCNAIINWPFAGFYEINLFNHNRLSNFVSIAFAQGSKGNSAPLSEGLISLESLKNGCPLRVEKPAKGQLLRLANYLYLNPSLSFLTLAVATPFR